MAQLKRITVRYIISCGEVSLPPANGREAQVTLHPTLLGLGPWNCQAVHLCCVGFRMWGIRPRPWASPCPTWKGCRT